VDFAHNSDLYAATDLAEGIDWARRFRRHERFNDALARGAEVPKTVILAPHGGGIERGTSELCLAVAGHHPANLPQVPPAGVTYDYWMFEGVRDGDNRELHVTSTGCDDEVAVSLCAGSLNALALHGFSDDDQVVLVGGATPDSTRNPLRESLLDGLRDAHFVVRDPGEHGELNGNDPCNIVNRTMLGMGAQLELSTPLRDAMFTEISRPRRKHTTTQLFWTFVAACRDAIERLEAEQTAQPPKVLRCPPEDC